MSVVNKVYRNCFSGIVLGFFAIVLLQACANKKIIDPVQNSIVDKTQHIPLYVGRPLEPWHVFIKNHERDQILSGAFAKFPDGTVRLTTSHKNVKEDALTLTYKDTWFSSLYIQGGEALDLRDFVKQGVVSFDIRVDDIKGSALDVIMSCGNNCTSKVRLREWAINNEQKGWKKLSIPMQCFNQSGADFNQITKPFSLEAGGKGQFSVANIVFNIKGQANFTCADLDKLSTIPATLNEYWAVDWWMPRHKEKVSIAAQGDIDLLMIGDSITHGWEKEGEGALVWQKHFKHIKTLNIGFGGDRTENVLWRLEHDTVKGISPKLAVMMIGTNNTGHRMEKPENIVKGVKAIIKNLKQQLPDTKILLLSIFPRGDDTTDALRTNNKKANIQLEALASRERILYADFNQYFLTDDDILLPKIMPDLLHPSETGYEIWAELLKPYFNKYLK